jgi:hypothetical protein
MSRPVDVYHHDLMTITLISMCIAHGLPKHSAYIHMYCLWFAKAFTSYPYVLPIVCQSIQLISICIACSLPKHSPHIHMYCLWFAKAFSLYPYVLPVVCQNIHLISICIAYGLPKHSPKITIAYLTTVCQIIPLTSKLSQRLPQVPKAFTLHITS